MIRLKRIYETPQPQDGIRILVERLWPRGLSREKACVSIWMKEIAPTTELRKWFAHDPKKWETFRQRYQAELADKQDLIDELKTHLSEGDVTFVYASKDTQHNSALVLKEYLEK